jgi:hypothetical protein
MNLRAVLAFALVVLPPMIASAGPDPIRGKLRDALGRKDVAGVVAVMADPIDSRGLWFADPACRQFNAPGRVAGDDRKKLVACVTSSKRVELMYDGVPGVAWISLDATLLAAEFKDGLVRSVGSVAPAKDEARLITMFRGHQYQVNYGKQVEVCFDPKGKVTSRRILLPSNVPSYDRAVTATLAKVKQVDPYRFDDQPTAGCDLIWFSELAGSEGKRVDAIDDSKAK